MNLKKLFFVVVAMAFIFSPSPVLAISQTIDQNYLPAPNLETPLNNIGFSTGQSFKPSLNRLTRIDVSLNMIAGPNPQISMTLTDSANTTIDTTTKACSSGLCAFTFDSPIQLTKNSDYRFYLQDPSGNYAWQGRNPGGYSLGTSIINGNPNVNQDFLFRTWGYNLTQTSPSDPSVLAPPTDVSASDIPNDEGKAVKLNWTSTVTTNYTGYNVYRAEKVAEDSDTRSWLLVGSANYNDEDYTDEEDLDPTKTYYYILRTYKGAYESEDSNEVEISPEDNIAPDAPKNLTINGFGKGFVNLSWDKVEADDLDGYQVSIARDPADLGGEESFSSTLETRDVGQDETTITFDRLSGGKTYYFVVNAKDTSGNLSPASNRVSQYLEGLNWVWYLLIGIVVAGGIGLYLYFAKKKRWWPFRIKKVKEDLE